MITHPGKEKDTDTASLSETTQGKTGHPMLLSVPLLAALKNAGTSHIYADTADSEELRELLEVERGALLEEIDGNTINQPLVTPVLKRYLNENLPTWMEVEGKDKSGSRELLPTLYSWLLGKIGQDIVHAFASGREWDISLQLHMRVISDLKTAKELGRWLHRFVPGVLVKVPLTPHEPECFLMARDFEKESIPVNFTSTFSARQAVAAALLGNVTRTNIFMGRLDQGLQAGRVGAHVALEAQRMLKKLRKSAGSKTQLIVASMRNWQSFILTAGCDVYTAPCKVLRAYLEQREVSLDSITSQLDTSYEDGLDISDETMAKMGAERIARLYHVESEFVEFLLEYRQTTEYRNLEKPDALVRRFEEAGFKDFFYTPTSKEWKELRRGKLPDLDAQITKQLALDTLFTLHADADFEEHQEEIDRQVARHLTEKI
ncbi:MAG: transaldolase family protein [Nitrospirales bacterium]